ncbi:MAG: hypothetical protein EA382_02260 [Spirochaetaceae bacterium]|nr:MAG: hypothetical protein EA382_02260 [Spirochaetaceae bacterium]
MILKRLEAVSFAALSGIAVDFGPSVTVVVGPNESGKSTLFAALRHSILTPTRQTPTTYRNTVERYAPRPDSTSAEAVLEFAIDAADDRPAVVRRRWGEAAVDELSAAGSVISGEAVQERINAALPVAPGTFAGVFLVDQAQLDRTIDQFSGRPETLEEIVSLLRRATSASDGVSAERFTRALDEQIEAVFAHWDIERDRPEKGRGIENPWARGVGALLGAYYDLERARADLREATRAEDELAAAASALADAEATTLRIESFVTEHRSAAAGLARSVEMDRQIESLRTDLESVRGAVRRWPVAVDELARADADAERLGAQVHELEVAYSQAGAARDRAERMQTYRAIRAARDEVAAAQAGFDAVPPVADDAVATLQRVESQLADAKATLTTGDLSVTVSSQTAGNRVTVTTDSEPPRELDPTQPVSLRASRHVQVDIDGVSIIVDNGARPYAELVAEYQALEQQLTDAAAGYGIATSALAAERVAERASRDADLRAATRRLAAVAGEHDFDALEAEFATDGSADPHTTAPASERDIAQQLGTRRQELGEATARRDQLHREVDALAQRYGDQDALEDRLVRLKSDLDALKAERADAAALPEGFASGEEFIDRYRTMEGELPAARTAHADARVRHAASLAALGEVSSESCRAVVTDAQARLASVRRRADTLLRLRRVVEEVRAEEQDDPLTSLVDLFAGYLAELSATTYTASWGDGGAPVAFARSDRPELHYRFLSQGTRDIVALAFRLALAEAALGSGVPAPLVLDDPFVDLDPERRVAAAAAIARYARTRQVVFMTCHPDHADLFPDAHRAPIGSFTR